MEYQLPGLDFICDDLRSVQGRTRLEVERRLRGSLKTCGVFFLRNRAAAGRRDEDSGHVLISPAHAETFTFSIILGIRASCYFPATDTPSSQQDRRYSGFILSSVLVVLGCTDRGGIRKNMSSVKLIDCLEFV